MVTLINRPNLYYTDKFILRIVIIILINLHNFVVSKVHIYTIMNSFLNTHQVNSHRMQMIQGGEGTNKEIKGSYNYGCPMSATYHTVKTAYLNKLKINVRYLKKIRFLIHSLFKLFCTANGESLRFVFIKNFKNLNLFGKFQIFNIQKKIKLYTKLIRISPQANQMTILPIKKIKLQFHSKHNILIFKMLMDNFFLLDQLIITIIASSLASL